VVVRAADAAVDTVVAAIVVLRFSEVRLPQRPLNDSNRDALLNCDVLLNSDVQQV
jgi:hypothetical protein